MVNQRHRRAVIVAKLCQVDVLVGPGIAHIDTRRAVFC